MVYVTFLWLTLIFVRTAELDLKFVTAWTSSCVNLWSSSQQTLIAKSKCFDSEIFLKKVSGSKRWTLLLKFIFLCYEYPMLRSSSTMPPMKKSCIVIFSFHTLCFGFRNDREIGGMESAHDSFIWSLSWHPLGHILCSGSNDHTRWETPPPLTSHSLATLDPSPPHGLRRSGAVWEIMLLLF